MAVNLAGLRRDAVVRGDTLCKPDTLRLSRMLDVRLTDLKDSHRIIENGSPVHFYHGAAAHIAKVVLLEQDTLEPGQSGFAQLRFTEPVAVKRGDPLRYPVLLPHGDHRRRHHSGRLPAPP